MIAKIPCGASVPCGDTQDFLAYPRYVASRKTPVTGAERAIGARIREARERLGVSIAELGIASGSTRQKVQFWERGEHFPPLRDFSRLCQLLRTDANTLLGLQAMTALSEQEVISARMQIQAIARGAKDEVGARRRVNQERLQRRSASTR